MQPIEIHDETEQEITQAADWCTVRNPSAAERFLEELNRAIEQIASNPNRWPKYLLGTRHLRLKKFPYFVIYRVLPNHVQIVAVAHERRRSVYWKKRR